MFSFWKTVLVLKFAVFDFRFCRAIQNTPSSGQLGVDMDEQIDEPSFGAVAGRGRKSSFCDGAVEMEEPVSQPVPRQRRNRAMIYSDTSDSDIDKSPPSNNNFPVTPLKSSSNEADTPKISSPSKRKRLSLSLRRRGRGRGVPANYRDPPPKDKRGKGRGVPANYRKPPQKDKGGEDRGVPANYSEEQNENTSQTSKSDTAKSSFDGIFEEEHDNLLQISLAPASPFPSHLNESTPGEVPQSSSSVRDGAITLDSLLEEHNRQKDAKK